MSFDVCVHFSFFHAHLFHCVFTTTLFSKYPLVDAPPPTPVSRRAPASARVTATTADDSAPPTTPPPPPRRGRSLASKPPAGDPAREDNSRSIAGRASVLTAHGSRSPAKSDRMTPGMRTVNAGDNGGGCVGAPRRGLGGRLR